MPEPRLAADLSELLPSSRAWNGGAGVSPHTWISATGSYELAVGYSLIFWPSFARFERYVLRDGFTETSVREWEWATRGNRQAVEAVMNHVHLCDIHPDTGDPSEDQLRYLGRVLKQTYAAKLRADFPDLRFEVNFPDEPGLSIYDYELTFWQIEP